MSKLTSMLLANGSLIKVNPSGSSYYLIGDKTVRVSDHLAPGIVIECLNIIIPERTKKQYIVIFMGHFYIHPSFTSLRVFLENWIMISKEYNKRLSCLECATVNKVQKQLIEAQALIIQQCKEIASLTKPIILIEPIVYDITDLSGLSDKQKKAIIRDGRIGSSLEKQITEYRQLNEENRLIKLIKKKKK